MFSNLSERNDPGAYYKPRKMNHPCINSLIPNVGYFQITTRLNHPIGRNQMKEIVRQTKMNTLYFVVPNTIFRKFQKQNFKENADTNSDTDTDTDMDVNTIETSRLAEERGSPQRQSLDDDDDDYEVTFKIKRRKLVGNRKRIDFQNDFLR
jgi:hypothetical protein